MERCTPLPMPELVSGAKESPADFVNLVNGSLFTITVAARIHCLRGQVWVTREGDSADYVLKRGQRFISSAMGKVVVQGLTDACIRIVAIH